METRSVVGAGPEASLIFMVVAYLIEASLDQAFALDVSRNAQVLEPL